MRQPVYDDYEIKENGDVYSLKFNRRKKLTPVTSGNGYKYVNICHLGKPKPMHIHRLVAMQYLPSQPSPKHEIRHLDGNPLNNNVDNLMWGTKAENVNDKIRHGRSTRGERHGMSRLTKGQVLRIKLLKGMVEHGYWTKLADALGVHRVTIYHVLYGQTWGWLK
jgi:hypothetical protein